MAPERPPHESYAVIVGVFAGLLGTAGFAALTAKANEVEERTG